MDISNNRNVWFAGGTSLNGSSAVIAAVSLNRNLKTIRNLQLDQYGMQTCSAIKRMNNSDDLVVGGLRKMLIMNWTGLDFVVNKVVENVHSCKSLLIIIAI